MYEIWNRITKLFDSFARWLLDQVLVDDEDENEKEKDSPSNAGSVLQLAAIQSTANISRHS